ncbi:MAG: OmpA family protein [Sulfurimonadaceae bacterium]
MRKILLSLSCIATLYAEQMYLYEASPIIGLMENGKSTGMNSSYAYGLQLQYNNLDFLIKPELSYIYSPNIEVYEHDEKAKSHLLMLNGVYDVEYTALLTPFLKAGVGYQSISDVPSLNSDSFLIGTGAGLKLNIKDQLAIKFETVITWHDFHENNILVFGGLDFSFGHEDNTPVAENVTAEPIEINTTKRPTIIVAPAPVYISKEDHNLTQAKPTNQEVAVRDSNDQIKSLTLFVPYLFRGYALDDDSKTTLEGYAKELRGQDNAITVIGHTGSKGRRAFNQELSLKRALVVKELFVEYGVTEERITIEGRGESEPIADSKNPAANKLNKRIEIQIQSK